MSEGPPPQEPVHGQATLARGASIGRYVVLGLVGRGGMGEVYAAYDPELDRKVAVKLLRIKPGAGVSLTEGRQRTLREAQAIARLSHPNVVVVYDVGTFEEKVFIAMEFVEGHTAGFWAQSQHRSWQETLKVYMAAGRGLVAAHQKGLVHRDFKPENVMVSRDGQVRVMDFGLARQADRVGATGEKAIVTDNGIVTTQRLPVPPADPAAPRLPLDGSTLVLTPRAAGDEDPADLEQSNSAAFDQRLTRTGAMMGTPAYMAPEQFRGHPTDARTDQFAFCIALYEALYDERPFAGNTLMALTQNVLNSRMRDAPADTVVPLWVRKILLRGLRVKADERWPSMGDLLDALGHNPDAARKRWLVASGGILALFGAGFLVSRGMADSIPVCGGGAEKLAGIWELVGPGQPETARQSRLHDAFLKTGKSYAKDVWATTSRALTNYARAWTDMYKENCEATAIHKVQSEEVRDLRMACLHERLGGLRALTNVFAEANSEVVENAVAAANALGSLDRCADVPLLRAVIRPPEDYGTRSRVEELRKRLTDVKARFDAGGWRNVLENAPGIVRDARGLGYQALVAESLLLEGNVKMRANDSRGAEVALSDAFLAAESSRHDEVRAEAAALLVHTVGYQQGRFEEGKRWAKLADAVLQRLGGHELLQAWVLNDVGNVLDLQGDWATAVQSHQQALALKERALGSDHPDVGISEINLAIALQQLGRNEDALRRIGHAIDLVEKGLGAGHPNLAIALSDRGEILNTLGRYREAREAFERARTIYERELGPANLAVSYALIGIGNSYVGEGKAAEALPPLERAFAIREEHEPELSRRAETRFALARALWESRRDRDRARKLAEEARTAYGKASAKRKLAEVETWLRLHGLS